MGLFFNVIAFQSLTEADRTIYIPRFFYVLVLVDFLFLNSWMLGSFGLFFVSAILFFGYINFSFLENILEPLVEHVSDLATEPADHMEIAVQLYMLFSQFFVFGFFTFRLLTLAIFKWLDPSSHLIASALTP